MTAEIMRIFGDYTYTALLTETILACIYALFAILMIAGVRSRVRCLMVPYLVYQVSEVHKYFQILYLNLPKINNR